LNALGRTLLLFWTIYALDFVTSALFIALGYGFAESNQSQLLLVTAPGLGSLGSWLLNQNIRLALGTVGVIAYVWRRGPIQKMPISFLLAFFSLVRLYGVATNIGFTLQMTLGATIDPAAYYALFCVPVVLLLRSDLLASFRMQVRKPRAVTFAVLTEVRPRRRNQLWGRWDFRSPSLRVSRLRLFRA
jgi:hypothetical protein